jgi:long-chain fatty acid transport protein
VSQDAFAAARGEAFVATADNPSAVYYNPAGITQLEGDHIRGGINGLYFDPTFTPPAGQANSGNTYHIENNYAAAPQLYYTHTWKTVPISAGFGVYTPYGASVTWPEDTGFRAVAIEGSLTYIRANPVVAVEIAPGLSLGCGVMVDYGSTTSEQGLIRNSFPFENRFRFEGDTWGVGYNVGLLWKASPKLSFGATFRSTTTMNFKGHTEIERQPIIQPTEIPASVEYEFPLTAVFGISYRPTPKWNLEVNADYTDWSTFDVLTIKQEEAPPFPVQQDIPVTLQWKPSWIYEIGVSHYFTNGWHASAGYVFNQNSVPDDYYSPLVADMDRHFIAAGVGRRGTRWSFDVTYQFGYGPEREVVNSTAPSAPGNFVGQNGDGTYEWISHAVLISVGFKF